MVRTVAAALTLLLLAFPAAGEQETPRESRYLSSIDASYPPATPPEKAPLFRLDLGTPGSALYSFQQVVDNEQLLPGQDISTTLRGAGQLAVKSAGGSIGSIVISQLKVTMNVDVGTEQKVVTQEAPPMVIPGLKEDGQVETDINGQNMLLQLLLPLPSGPLKVGESSSRKVTMPFNAGGSGIAVPATVVTRLAQYVVIDDRTCAKFVSDIALDEVKVPEEIQGTYSVTLKGRTVAFFDLKARRFVQSDSAVLMSLSFEVPLPKEEPSGEEEPADLPESMKLSMESDNRISIKLIGD